MALLGRLRAEHQAWLLAWRSRRENPLAQFAALEFARAVQCRPAWLPCSRFMFAVGTVVSLATTYLIVLGLLRFVSVANSPVATSAFGWTALAWTAVQLCDGAVVVSLAWLAERLVLGFSFASGLLARYASRNEALGNALAPSLLSDYDYLVGALSHITRLCWPPLGIVLVFSAVTDYVYYTGILNIPYTNPPMQWTSADLLWIALLAGFAVALKAQAGLLAIWAAALLLLAFGPWWRNSALAYGAAWLACAWQAPALMLAAPPFSRVQYPGLEFPDWISAVAFADVHWLASLTLLAVLAPSALAAQAMVQAQVRHRMWRHSAAAPALVAGMLVALLLTAGTLQAWLESTAMQFAETGVGDTAVLIYARLCALSAVPFLPFMAGAEMCDSSVACAYSMTALRLLPLLGIALSICLIFAAVARDAVHLRRSVVG